MCPKSVDNVSNLPWFLGGLEGSCGVQESLNREQASGVLGGPTGFRHPGSGVIVLPIRIILLFYFFIFLKKKNTGTLEQIGQQYIKSLKSLHKIDLKCSEHARTFRTSIISMV